MTKTCTFAVVFGTRGFFPVSLIAGARTEMEKVISGKGHRIIMLPEDATRYGAVESPQDGEAFARLVRNHQHVVDGIIVCLPNFGDETGVVAAVKDAGVPILVQAYPDELDHMAPDERRDAFCGKFSVMDVLTQYGVPFTNEQPHVCHPRSEAFSDQLDRFAATCRVTKGLKNLTVGAIGARTTAFKTVRIDEVSLQHQGITVETFDLSDVFARMRCLAASDEAVREKREHLLAYTCWDGVPDEAIFNLSRCSVVIDHLIDEARLDALTFRCWLEIQKEFKISPCVLLSELNDRNVVAACELDIGNAVAMQALKLASGNATACLDWNNNYGEDPNKCILFHCGPVPQRMMISKGRVVDHSILAAALGPNCSYGCNVGRIAATPMTYASLLTENGRLKYYAGEAVFTADPIPENFFGCAGVAEIDNLQSVLQVVGSKGYRHHVSVTPGHVLGGLKEAMTTYLDVDLLAFEGANA